AYLRLPIVTLVTIPQSGGLQRGEQGRVQGPQKKLGHRADRAGTTPSRRLSESLIRSRSTLLLQADRARIDDDHNAAATTRFDSPRPAGEDVPAECLEREAAGKLGAVGARRNLDPRCEAGRVQRIASDRRPIARVSENLDRRGLDDCL